jgi:hypothetical protein
VGKNVLRLALCKAEEQLHSVFGFVLSGILSAHSKVDFFAASRNSNHLLKATLVTVSTRFFP